MLIHLSSLIWQRLQPLINEFLVIYRLGKRLNHRLRHLARVLLSDLFISFLWHISVEHHFLLLLLVSRIPLSLFSVDQLEIGLNNLWFLLHLLVLFHLSFMFSLLFRVYIWEVSPHFNYTLFMLFDTFLVINACLLKLFKLKSVKFPLAVNDAHECLLAFLVFMFDNCLLILLLFILLLFILLEMIDFFVHSELILKFGLLY